MRVARFKGNKKVVLEEVPRPSPGPGELLVKVSYCGLCGSERAQYLAGYHQHQGHELTGEVVANGQGTILPPGTKVAGYLTKFCGHCASCQTGYTTACTAYRQKENLGWSWPGGFAEYVVLPEQNAVPLQDAVDEKNAVLLLDTLGTPFHGLRLLGVDHVETAFVLGCGTVGLGTIIILKALGVKMVLASDYAEYRLKVAGQLGAIPVSPEQASIDEPDFQVDLAVEAVGLPQTLRQGLHLTRPGGKLLSLGELPDAFSMEIDLPLRLKDQTIVRSWYYPLKEFAENLKLWREGFFKQAPALISHVYGLEQMQEAADLFYSGQSLKVLIKP